MKNVVTAPAGEHVETSAASQRKKTHHIAVAAMLTAVAFVLQFIEFPIPIMPSFVKLDISDLPALLGTFSLGPVYGVAIQLAKNIIHLPFGSSAGVGELCNFILGAVFVLAAGLVYRKMKSRAGRRARRRGPDGAAQPADQLLLRVSGVCGAVPPAARGDCRDVSGDPRQHRRRADGQCPAQLPDGVQRPVHAVQGPPRRGAVLPDLQTAFSAAA